MGLEFELKYTAKAADLCAIKEQFGDFSPITMETTYFDTADHALSAQKITLRRRYENGRSVCTVKTPAASYGRGEWDVQENWSQTAVQQLFAAADLAPIPFDKLIPVCGARFTRLAKTVTLPEFSAEIALDEGILYGGETEIPLCEVEVELKTGSQDALCS